MKRDPDTVEMFPALDNTKVRKLSDREKYDRIIIERTQTNLFKPSTKGTK